MSTIESTVHAGLATRLRVPGLLVALTLAVAIAAAALTVALIDSGGSGGGVAPQSVQAAPEGQYLGGPAEGRGGSGQTSAPANDGSQHAGARP